MRSNKHHLGVEVVAWPEAEVPVGLRRQVVALQDEAWPSGPRRDALLTHDPALHPLSMLLVDGGHVIAALDILFKEIVHDRERYAAAGLSTVVTGRAHRGGGRGRALVEAARARMAAEGADVGLFTCDRPLQAFYERTGWRLLRGTVLIGGTREAPLASDWFGKVTMGAFFSARARRSEGAFVGRRVELYTGEIDRLW